MKENKKRNFNGLKGFVIGTAFGVAFSIGVLFGTGHLVTNTSKVSTQISYIQLDGFSFK